MMKAGCGIRTLSIPPQESSHRKRVPQSVHTRSDGAGGHVQLQSRHKAFAKGIGGLS